MTPGQRYYRKNKRTVIKAAASWKESNPKKVKESAAQWRKKHPDYSYRAKLKRDYGLSWEQYQKMLAAQKNVCAICERPPKHNRLSVDHDHTTKRVRGALCYPCNRRLVGRHRTGELLRRAATYVDSTIDWRKA